MPKTQNAAFGRHRGAIFFQHGLMSEQLLEIIRNYILPLLPAMNLELVEIQFRKEGHGWVLRIFIDHADGVTLEHCASVSRQLSAYLDVEELIDHAYHLEVSSPGLERPLYSLDDFTKYAGKNAKVKLREPIEGQKVYTGEIAGVSGEEILMIVEKKKEIRFTFSLVSKARLAI